MSAGYDRDNREGATIMRFYDFGIFRIDTSKRLLLKDGEPVQLTPKAFDTLLLLVENKGQLVSKDELMSRLWPERSSKKEGVTRNVITRSPGEGLNPQYIVTVPDRVQILADVCGFRTEPDLRVNERTRTTSVGSEERRQTRLKTALNTPRADTARAQLADPLWKTGRLAKTNRRPFISRIGRHIGDATVLLQRRRHHLAVRIERGGNRRHLAVVEKG